MSSSSPLHGDSRSPLAGVSVRRFVIRGKGRERVGANEIVPPGTHAALAAGMDAYHAVNLREALKLVPDTGDWHGSLRIACDMVLDEQGDSAGVTPWPNQTAEQMADAAIRLGHKARGTL